MRLSTDAIWFAFLSCASAQDFFLFGSRPPSRPNKACPSSKTEVRRFPQKRALLGAGFWENAGPLDLNWPRGFTEGPLFSTRVEIFGAHTFWCGHRKFVVGSLLTTFRFRWLVHIYVTFVTQVRINQLIKCYNSYKVFEHRRWWPHFF
jgi:hypothetical protein